MFKSVQSIWLKHTGDLIVVFSVWRHHCTPDQWQIMHLTTNNKCQCQAEPMAHGCAAPIITASYSSAEVSGLGFFLFFCSSQQSAQQPKVNPDYLRESDVNANDWGQAGTFRLMLICLRVAARTPCTSIWSLTSKDKQWCKSAHPQSMSFLEVIHPSAIPTSPQHVHLHGPGEVRKE